MTYKVTFTSGNHYSVKVSQPVNYKTSFAHDSSINNYSVKVSQSENYKASFAYNLEVMPRYLNELYDVQISGNYDKYVLMYDSTSGKWKNINPDEVLNAAASTETLQPGLVGYATTFLDRIDIDLDDRIDLDAGTF